MSNVEWREQAPVDGATLFAAFRQAESGRYVLAGVMLCADKVTGEMLRRIPVAMIENARNADGLPPALDGLPPLRRQPGMDQQKFSELVAAHHRAWAAITPHPVARMAEAASVKPPTMHTWVREARLRGLLGPARRKKASA